MRKISLYGLIFLLISSFSSFAQKGKELWRHEGPRIGVDLSRFIAPLYSPGDRFAWEVQGDYPVKGIWFPTVEIGMLNLKEQYENYFYKNNGAYGRIGVDLSILKFEALDDHDFAFAGIRYGYSRYTHEADNIFYSNYWGDLVTSVPENSLSAHWGEVVFGMKGELFRNLFVGWSWRIKFVMVQTKDQVIDPFIVPGVGRTDVEIPMDFTYGLYYRIPTKKSKKIPKPLKMGGAKHISDEVPQDNRMDMRGGMPTY